MSHKLYLVKESTNEYLTFPNTGEDIIIVLKFSNDDARNFISFIIGASFAVDMLSLSTALEQFDSHGLRAQNDKLIDIPDMVTVLTSLYEVITADNPTQVSVPLCIDLAINWLLNVYDRWARSTIIRN